MNNLGTILKKHKLWFDNDPRGERADLTDANLTRADLTRADLRGADLTRADLTDAVLRGAVLRGADLTDADLTRANLTRADLTRANLTDANLTGAIGNGKEVKSIQTDVWAIVYTDSVIQIGCENHSINNWFGFSDDRISEMDSKALEFWRKWKPILMNIMEIK